MPVVYKVLTGIVALVGNLSLITTGQIHPVFVGLSSAMFIGYWRAIKGMPQAGRYTIAGLSIITFGVFLFDTFVFSRDVIVSVGHLSLVWQSLKSFDIKDPWDPLQVFFMALIQLFLASELTRSILFGIVFVIFMVSLVYAVVYSHFIKEGLGEIGGLHRPVISITVLVLILTVLFFISIPRVRGGLWGKGIGKSIRTGFTKEVNLGGLGSIKEDYTVVMRATVTPIPSTIPYWRGITYEIYLDGEWIDADRETEAFFSRKGRFKFGPTPRKAYLQDIILEPVDTELVFTLKGIRDLKVPSTRVRLSADGALYIPRDKNKRLRYRVLSNLGPQRRPPQEVHIQFPEGLDRLRNLAIEVAGGAGSSVQKAERIIQYLRSNYTYSLNIKPPIQGQDPVEDFLFNQKKGYCEHFATAMVLMLRATGVPARLVTGFAGGQFNRYGRYFIVRQRDAHTWVEAWVGDHWEEFDPTPSSIEGPPSQLALFLDYIRLKWDRYVVGFSSRDQRDIIRFFSIPLKRAFEVNLKGPNLNLSLWPVYLLVLLMFFLFLRRLFHWLRYPEWTRRYLRLRKKLGLSANATPGDVLQQIRVRMKDKKEGYEKIVITYLQRRFGPK